MPNYLGYGGFESLLVVLAGQRCRPRRSILPWKSELGRDVFLEFGTIFKELLKFFSFGIDFRILFAE